MGWTDDDSRGKDGYGLIPDEEYDGTLDHLRTQDWDGWLEEEDIRSEETFADGQPVQAWYDYEARAEKKREREKEREESRPDVCVLNEMFQERASAGESFIRDKLREVSFDRKIIPPTPPPKGGGSGDFLSLFSDSLVKVVDIEPESRAMAITWRGQERGAPIKKG